MAEKSIRIADQSSGDRIATRDAFEQDDLSNARVIERVDFASGKFSSPIGSSNRGSSAHISTDDDFDLTNLDADLTGNLITVGDKSMLCVSVEHTEVDGECIITPILYDNEISPNIVAILEPKTFTMDANVLMRRGSGSGNYISKSQYWDCLGSYQIGLHISGLSASNTVQVWGWLV